MTSDCPDTSSALKIVGISGNTHRPSRSRALVETIAQHVASQLPAEYVLYDIVDAGPGLGAAFERDELPAMAERILAAIEGADALIVATPVYKGSYRGLFKHLFDLVDPLALIDRPVLIAATGGGPRHALVVEHHLRPLFGFFTALAMPTAVYASDSDFCEGEIVSPIVLDRIAVAAAQFAALIGLRARQAYAQALSASGSDPHGERTLPVRLIRAADVPEIVRIAPATGSRLTG